MSNIIAMFSAAAKGKPSRDTVQIVDGHWQVKISGKAKWKATCDAVCIPGDAEQTIDGDVLTVRWPSYADMIFGEGGLMAQHLPDYQPRQGQLIGARIIQRAIEMGEPAVIEAPTGTGKGFMYAAICMAMDKRVTISTSNKALQMQLINKDIPFLQKLFPGKTMALAQGKGNYICLDRCAEQAPPVELRQWIRETETGSVEELAFNLHDINKYTVDDECTGKRCDHYATCFYYKERAKRDEADIIVCNHALLAMNHHLPFAELLPATDVVVVDEAHQLPNYVRNAIGLEYHANKVRRALQRIWDKDGVNVGTADSLLLSLEHDLVQFLSQHGDKQILIPNEYEFASGLELVDEMREIAKQVFPVDGDVDSKEDYKKSRRAEALRRLASEIKQLCSPTEEGHVRWVDVEMPTIVDAPHDVSGFIHSMVEGYFLTTDDEQEPEEPDVKPTYIFTSATLATPKLDGFMAECGITHGFQLIAESPFDYERNALLYVPNGSTPPPTEPDYIDYLVEEVRKIVFASKGGAFLLFTSWLNMNKCLEALRGDFEKHYPVYVQGELPKMEIARRFQEDHNAVLFATKTFWEGVDIPGDSLRTVIIDKMPFAAKSPLNEVRYEKSANGFNNVSLPEMIIDLKQGAGRLVRRSTDRGVIAILDSRIRSKGYGRRQVIKSLPPARLIHSTASISEFFAEQFYKPELPDLTKRIELPSADDDFTLEF